MEANFFDKIVAAVDPVKGYKRMAARTALKFVNSGYSEGGASHEKRWARGFNSESYSPQQDIDENQKTLRERSRMLEMNTPIGAAAVSSTTSKTIGTGLYLKPCLDYEYLGMTQEEAEAWERNTEREFALWAESKECDATRMHTFYEMQEIAFRGMLSNGDGLGVIKYAPATPFMPYQLRLQIVEADRLSTPLVSREGVQITRSSNIYGKNEDNGNRIVNGIEIDKDGKLTAYWICNQYPDEYARPYEGAKEWCRVDAYGKRTGNPNVLHLFRPTRAGSYRGVPILAPVIEELKQVSRYSEAEIMAAVISGMFTAFITHNGAGSSNPFGAGMNPFAAGVPNLGGDGKADEPVRTNVNDVAIGNGAIVSLEEGEGVEIANPTRPNPNYDGFIVAACRQIGAAIEIPYEVLLKSFNSSYSASRAALLEAAETFRKYRTYMEDDFCQPVYSLFLAEAVATGRIKADGFFSDPLRRKAWCAARWNSTATVPVLDPVKEVTAAKMRCEEGFSTREQETVALNGGDFKANVQQLERENAMVAKANAARNTTQPQNNIVGMEGTPNNGDD